MISNRHAHKGFTLIELLVVIAIIAILAAILFPVFAKAREKARQTSCASNEKQLGLGFVQYVQDYDEKMPGGTNPTPGLANGWASQIYSYEKSTGVFKCPDDSTAVNPGISYPISYGLNSNLASSGAGISLAQFNSPTKTIVLFEVSQAKADPTAATETASVVGNGIAGAGLGSGLSSSAVYETGYMNGGATTAANANYDSANSGKGWHTDGANYLFADSHVKWTRADTISAGVNNSVATSGGSFTGGDDTVVAAAGATAAGTGYSPSVGSVTGTFSYN